MARYTAGGKTCSILPFPSSSMSGKSSPTNKSRPSSHFSRAKQRLSSFFSRSGRSRLASSPVDPCFPGDNTSNLDGPSYRADIHLAPAPVSQRASLPSVSAPSIANALPVDPPRTELPTHPLENSVSPNYSSTRVAPSLEPQSLQGRSLTSQEQSHAPGAFGGAHHFSMNCPVFIDYSTAADNFMKELLQETIIGAEFNSSARHPPPRCHPGTHLAIIQRCLDFIVKCSGEEKLRWVVGPAGVGKSAVMQMITEQAPDGVIFASVFLSVNGRANGSKTIMTVAYQLAVECGPYRQFIRSQIIHDPSLLRKSQSVQFNKFIVEPFIHQRLFEPSCRFLMVIDGLDECDKVFVQQELLELITDFCINYPMSPIAWIVASRPEPHITFFFERDKVKRAYTKEEMEIDSNEACEEVQKYLYDELKKIQLEYRTLRHKRVWPLEHEFTKIASSAGGLFAYAATVVRYISDPYYRDPAAQLRRVLETIDAGTKDHMSGRNHPMAQLDALYKRILSTIPDDAMINTKKPLLACSSYGLPLVNFRELCNILGLTEVEAYGSICQLYAVMKIPEPEKGDDEPLSYYHKSFQDFLFDFQRSGLSDNLPDEARQLCAHASVKILEEVPCDSDSVAGDQAISLELGGRVKGRCDNVSLSWPCDERFRMTDEELRIKLYNDIMDWICSTFRPDDGAYGCISWFHALTTRFIDLGQDCPWHRLRGCVFDKFHDELTALGKLKQVPLRALDYAAICDKIDLRFMSPIETDVKLSDPWNPSCEHKKEEISGILQRQGWSTSFRRYCRVDSGVEDDGDANIPRFHTVTRQQPHEQFFQFDYADNCARCSRCFARHFMNNPDQLATVFPDGTQLCYVEWSFVDPDDGVSEWRYRFFHSGPPTGIDA